MPLNPTDSSFNMHVTSVLQLEKKGECVIHIVGLLVNLLLSTADKEKLNGV